MRTAVDTAELAALAGRLRAAAETAGRAAGPVDAQAGAVAGWCDETAREAAHAFLATVAWAARGLRDGAGDLATGVATSGASYEHVEAAATPGR